jgi:putative transcriptional regulator
MPIIVNLDVMLAKRKMRVSELAEKVGVTLPNLSILKTGKAKAIRFSTLEAICRELHCQPGDLMAYEPDDTNETCETTDSNKGALSGVPPHDKP